jgi:predicted TIM-barrel fold metal-dependent hydrolase
MTRREFISRSSGLLAGTALVSQTSGATAETVRGITGPFRVIDVHDHILNTAGPNLTEAARKYHPPHGTIETLIRKMDEAGVDHGFLLTYSAEDLGAEIRARNVDPIDLKPVVNRTYQINAWKAHRDRFWLYVNYSNALKETFPDDLERDLEQGAVGWKYMPVFYGFLADNHGFLPGYEVCRRHRASVIIDLCYWLIGSYQPYRPESPSTRLPGGAPDYPLYNETRERQRIVKSLEDYARLLDPVFSAFPTVPILLAHRGTPRDDKDFESVLSLVKRHANVYLDTSAQNQLMSRAAYRGIIEAVGVRKLMWGTDWIGSNMDKSLSSWRMIQDQCDFLSEAEKAMILHENALRFAQGEA